VRSPASSGFSLVEALVALLILEVALLMGLAILLEQPRIIRRLDRQRQTTRALESTLELVRAGALPLATGPVETWLALAGTPPPAGTSVLLEVDPAPPPSPQGLFHVTVRARWVAAGRLRTREVETLVWSPDASP
jgi:type II secretory pathway pseudopilin PulG